VAGIAALEGRDFFQLGIVVADLESALRRYAKLWNTGTWRLYTVGAETLEWCEYRGAPGVWSAKIALNDRHPQVELIQPIAGPGIHDEWLSKHGEGPHHLAIAVDSIEETSSALAASGYERIAAGSGFGDGAFAYFDTVQELGIVLEAVKPPTRTPEPESVWNPA
jgi:glyoxalase/bleomycin resistance protein/dioxygenase superfamily protein